MEYALHLIRPSCPKCLAPLDKPDANTPEKVYIAGIRLPWNAKCLCGWEGEACYDPEWKRPTV